MTRQEFYEMMQQKEGKTATAATATGGKGMAEITPDEPAVDAASLDGAAVESVTLKNGVRVYTRAAVSPSARIELRIGGGTRADGQSGTSQFLKHMSFQRSQLKSPVRKFRELELSTGGFGTRLGRESLVFHADLMRPQIAAYGETMLDLLFPMVREYIVRDLRDVVRGEMAAAQGDMSMRTLDALHAVAFGYEGLGNPLMCHPDAIDRVSPDDVAEYVDRVMHNPANIAVTAYGVGPDEPAAWLEECIGAVPFDEVPVPDDPRAPSKYAGGVSTVHLPGKAAFLAVAFSAAPRSDAAGWARDAVMAEMLGCKADGLTHPGASLGSRLNHATAADPLIFSAAAIHASYSDAGLFGVAGSANPGHAGQLAKTLVAELKALASDPAKGLARAKASAKAALTPDTRAQHSALLADVADFNLDINARLAAIEKVSASNIENAAKKMISSQPSISAIGDLRTLPVSIL